MILCQDYTVDMYLTDDSIVLPCLYHTGMLDMYWDLVVVRIIPLDMASEMLTIDQLSGYLGRAVGGGRSYVWREFFSTLITSWSLTDDLCPGCRRADH